jgi:hypothetical protein
VKVDCTAAGLRRACFLAGLVFVFMSVMMTDIAVPRNFQKQHAISRT